MPSMLAFATPLALILPLLGQGTANVPASAPDDGAKSQAAPMSITASSKPETANPLNSFYRGSIARQVRIEQRVTIRIAPQRQSPRQNMLAQLPQRELSTRFEERKMDKCLAVDRIAGVQTGRGNRLLLFMRDQRIVSVNLEKACLAREFYSGFYVEKNDDGKLCVDRDKLQSRSGAKCEVERMRRLVAVQD